MEPITRNYRNLQITVFEKNLEIKDACTNIDLDIDNVEFESYYNKFYESRISSYKDLDRLKSNLSDTRFTLYSIINNLKKSQLEPLKAEVEELDEEVNDPKKSQLESLNSIIEKLNSQYEVINKSLNEVNIKSHAIANARSVKNLIKLFRNGYESIVEDIENKLATVASGLGAIELTPCKDLVRFYLYNKLDGDSIDEFDIIELLPRSFTDKLCERFHSDSIIDDVLIEGIFEDPIYWESRRSHPSKSKHIEVYNRALECKLPDLVSKLNLVPSSGPAKTLVGNMLRACDRIAYKWYNDDNTGYRWSDDNFLETWNLADELNRLNGEDREFLSKYLDATYNTFYRSSLDPNVKLLDKISLDTVISILSDPDYINLREYYHNLDVKFESRLDLARVLLNEEVKIPYCDLPGSEFSRLTVKLLDKVINQLDGKQYTDGTVTITVSASDLSYSYIVNNQIYLEPFMDAESLKLLKFIKVTDDLIKNSKVSLSNPRSFTCDITVFEDGYSAAGEAIAIQAALYLALQDNPEFLKEPDDRDWRLRANYSNILKYGGYDRRYGW